MDQTQELNREIVVDSVPGAWPGYPAAVRGGGFVFVSGVRGGRPDSIPSTYGDLPSDLSARAQGYTLVDDVEGVVAADAWAAHDNLERVLAVAGTRSDQILRQHIWQRDKRYYPVLERVRKHCHPETAPSSGLGVLSVGGRFGRWYGIDSFAVDIEDPNCHGERTMLTAADDAVNPSASIYSQMVASGPLVFMAGHIPVKTTAPGQPLVATFDDVPEEGRFLATGRSHPDARDGPIAAQAWFVYNEIQRTLAAHDMAMSDIVHVRVYLADLRDFATFHRVHSQVFGDSMPALSVAGFDEVGHKGCRIEIEPTALLPGDAARAAIDWPCPAPFAGPGAMRAGPLLLMAGMVGIGADGKPVKDAEPVDAAARDFVRSLERLASTPALPAQIWWSWRNMQTICASAGLGVEAIAKTVVYLRTESDLNVYEAIRSMFVADALPAFDCAFVPGPGPTEDLCVQIDATAVAAPS